jgi:hypothetical protein
LGCSTRGTAVEDGHALCGLSVGMVLFYGYIAGQNAAKGI